MASTPKRIELEFAFSAGARVPRGANPQLVGAYLENLRLAHGGQLTALEIVTDARDRTSPLHPWFEWSNTKAAEAYRLDQARHLARSIEIVYRSDPQGGPQTTRAYINLKAVGDANRAYHAAVEVMGDTARRERALRTAWKELQSFKAKYQNLQEFAQLFATVQELERSLPPLIEAAD